MSHARSLDDYRFRAPGLAAPAAHLEGSALSLVLPKALGVEIGQSVGPSARKTSSVPHFSQNA